MQLIPHRPALLFAGLLALASLGGCADVRQNPASSVVNAQTDASTQQNVAPRQTSPTNIPF